MNKFLLGIDLIKSMGFKPVAYRAAHVFKKKTGLLKKSFPSNYEEKTFITLNDWRRNAAPFFFESKEQLGKFALDDENKLKLRQEFERIRSGELRFFNGNYLKVGKDYDWITNPENKFRYDISKHWTELETLDEEKGDIKLIWEKSRFCYLYTLIRYDYHFKEDQSEFVFSEIMSWIEKNPLNMGPNYSCSQEISLRIFNWIFALYCYKHSPALTEERFRKIINLIYYQAWHVQTHIKFSLLTVRNNHAITECLLLYVTGILFPFFPESKEWKEKGKKLLEQEGLYQIYEDGSYIQFSMNYERVVLQLFTWAFYLGRANNDSFSSKLVKRVEKAFQFLYQSQDSVTGMLPNYGHNDGALFFPLNQSAFRDYRGQLNAMFFFLHNKGLYGNGPWEEDIFWFSGKHEVENESLKRVTSAFDKGGYYVLREEEKFAFIRCGSHPDRPSQADNLHLDLWYRGKNILRDAGSYKYNTSKETIRFFMGTASHNTVMIGGHDQMLKGGRFLWFYWTKVQNATLHENDNEIVFSGAIKAFQHLSKNIIHHRLVKQKKKEAVWEIEDRITGIEQTFHQIWNMGPEFFEEGFKIETTDEEGKKLTAEERMVDYSSSYGAKELSTKQLIFSSGKGFFKTRIYKS